MTETTAIYPNRIEDKELLERKLFLLEEGNNFTEFLLPNGSPFAKGYIRIVYGDHGPYLEFNKEHIKCSLVSYFRNVVDYDNLPDESCKYYYYWLHPNNTPKVKVYLQIKSVANLPNAPHREDGKPSSFNRSEGYADYKRGLFYVDPYALRIQDPRKTGLKDGLRQLTAEQLQRVIDYPKEMVLDSFNYEDGKFCPLAVALELDKNIIEPTHDKVFKTLTSMGYRVYNTRGIEGKFYTENRLEDLLAAAKEVLLEITNNQEKSETKYGK